MKKRVSAQKRVIMGPILILSGILLQFLFPEVPVSVGSALIGIGVAFVVIGIRLMRDPDAFRKDERTKKISSYAAAYSWFTTFIFMGVLSLLDTFGIASIPSQALLGILMFEMTVVMLFSKWYLMRRGDIQ